MSTNFYSGYAPEKPTSKVMAPPGGRSNNIFGFFEEEKKPANGTTSTGASANGTSNGTPITTTSPIKQDLTPQQLAAANKHNNIHGTNIFGGSTDNTDANRPAKPRDNTQAKLFGEQNGDSVAKTKKRTGYNTITGKLYAEEDEEKEKEKLKHQQQQQQQQQQQPHTNSATVEQQQTNVHTSSRVLQPPGGRSTKLW